MTARSRRIRASGFGFRPSTADESASPPPTEAATLIAAVRPDDQALWAVAFYAGLRRGEIAALDWARVDLEAGLLRVERAWDEQAGFIDPKSFAGRRVVPVAGVLRAHLERHRMVTARDVGLLFGVSPRRPFTPSAVRRRALTAWRRAELDPIQLHEARHTFASMMIAAGVNAKAISRYMGHSSIEVTFDLYGHLMPGNEREAAVLLDRYLVSFGG